MASSIKVLIKFNNVPFSFGKVLFCKCIIFLIILF
jgi:hypothetical protein